MKTTIRVTGMDSKTFSNGGTKHILLDEKKKYNFYATKRDGNPTKAMEGYDKLRPRIGDVLIAEVEVEEKSFEDPKTHKTVHYDDNRILYFYENGEELEKAQTATTHTPAPAQKVPGSHADVIFDPSIHQKLDEILSYLRPKAAPVSTIHPEIPTVQIDDEEEEPIDISKVPF